jgi:hypothetical protein
LKYLICKQYLFLPHALVNQTPPPRFCKLWNTVHREIINILTVMMKTIKKRLNRYAKYILMGITKMLVLTWESSRLKDLILILHVLSSSSVRMNPFFSISCLLYMCVGDWLAVQIVNISLCWIRRLQYMIVGACQSC